MPIYAYRCSACGHAKDVLQKLSDPVLSTCPACGAEAFSKQVTAAGFQLKGSGWYATDFKGSGAAPAADAKSDAKSDSKSDAKPDAKFRHARVARTCGTGGRFAQRRHLTSALDEPQREKVHHRRPAGVVAPGHHHLGAAVAAGPDGRACSPGC